MDIVDRLCHDFSVNTAYAAVAEIQRLRLEAKQAAERIDIYSRTLKLIIAAHDDVSWAQAELASFAEDALSGKIEQLEKWEEKYGPAGDG